MSDQKFEAINRLAAEGPLVKVTVNGVAACALINTGFEASVIDGEFAESLGVPIIPAGVNQKPDGSLFFSTATGCRVDIAIIGAILTNHPCQIGRLSKEIDGKTWQAPYKVILSRDALAGKLRFTYNGIEGRFSLESH